MDDFEEILKLERESKKQIDKMYVDYLSRQDFFVCDYVLDQFVGMEVTQNNYGKTILLNELVEKSIAEMRIFGADIEYKILDLLSKIPIECVSNQAEEFGVEVSYSFDDNDCVMPNSGVINKYIVPSKLYELSIYYFVHEHIHAIKDSNYKEYKSCITLGETIPLFYELIVYNSDEVLKKELLKFRMLWLLNNSNDYFLLNYLYLDEWINEWGCETGNDIKCDVYEFMISKVGCYLNSFYYAVILYNMYKESPKKILDLVARVLKHEITTLEMLEMLGIYGDIRGSVFEKELNGIKRVLK